MKDKDLETEWAWTQVEAMADGSLAGEEARRVRAAMRADPALAAAVARARRLRRELGQLGRMPLPDGLGRRLLAIAERRRPRARLGWSVPAAAAFGIVVGMTGLLVLEQISRPPPERQVAVREFQLAMSYLQRSAAVTSDDVTRELTNGLRDALAVSRSAVLDPESESQNGERDDEQK